jgi:hypothetical protein
VTPGTHRAPHRFAAHRFLTGLGRDVTEKAFSEDTESFGALLKRGAQAKTDRWVDKVVALPARNAEAPPIVEEERISGVSPMELSSAVELVQEASEAIRISEQRVEELEAQFDQYALESTDEIRRLNAELQASEQRLMHAEERLRQTEHRAQQAESRASQAESRAAQAEAWLVRLHDAVQSGFGPLQRRLASRKAAD